MGIVINNLSHKYNNKNNSINNITMELFDNKIYGIIGKSGSGKTTLLELIDGLLKPTTGKIIVNETNDIKKIRKQIGFVFQFPEEQFFEENVKKEVEFSAKNFKIKNKKVNEVLKLVGLSESYLHKNLYELSNGEKRLIAIASILIYNPKIILLDEPTIGLDYKNKKKILRIINLLKNKCNKTIIIVSHDIDFIYKICDDLIVIDKGSLIMYGDCDSVFKEKELIDKYKIDIPKVIKFEELVKIKKNIKLMHSTSVNDLIKEVYRNV